MGGQYPALGGLEYNAKIQLWAKKSQKLEKCKKDILHFSEALFHLPWSFIPQINSQTSLYSSSRLRKITTLKRYALCVRVFA